MLVARKRVAHQMAQDIAAGVFSTDRRGNPHSTYVSLLGHLATVRDVELEWIALALASEETVTLGILSDSRSAVRTVRNPL